MAHFYNVVYNVVRVAGTLKYIYDFFAKYLPKVSIKPSIAKSMDGILQIQDIAHPLAELALMTKTGSVNANFYNDFNWRVLQDWAKYFINPAPLKLQLKIKHKLEHSTTYIRLVLIARLTKLATELFENKQLLQDEWQTWSLFKAAHQKNLKKTWQNSLKLYLYHPLSFSFSLSGAIARARINFGKLLKVSPYPLISYSTYITIQHSSKPQQFFYAVYILSLARIILKESWKFFKTAYDIIILLSPPKQDIPLNLPALKLSLAALESIQSNNELRITTAKLISDMGKQNTQGLDENEYKILAHQAIEGLTANFNLAKTQECNVRQAALAALLNWTDYIDHAAHNPTLKILARILAQPQERSENRHNALIIYQQLDTKTSKNGNCHEFIVERVANILNSAEGSPIREEAAKSLYHIALLPGTSAAIFNSIKQALRQAQSEGSIGPQFKAALDNYLSLLSNHITQHAEAGPSTIPYTNREKALYIIKKSGEMSISALAVISALNDFQDEQSTSLLLLKESEKLLYAYQAVQQPIMQASLTWTKLRPQIMI